MPDASHHRPVAPGKRQFARSLRRGQTVPEEAMWRLLRNRRFLHCKFRRQVPFRNYILDFVCFERHLVVEIDGSQHLDSRADELRDAILKRAGFRVVRYWNDDVLQRPDAVLENLSALLDRDKG